MGNRTVAALAALAAAYSVLPIIAPGLFDAAVGPITPEYAREQVPAAGDIEAHRRWMRRS